MYVVLNPSNPDPATISRTVNKNDTWVLDPQVYPVGTVIQVYGENITPGNTYTISDTGATLALEARFSGSSTITYTDVYQ